jgi:hypothetical protein
MSQKIGTKQERKRRGKQRAIKKPNQKRRKDNKTLSQKSEKWAGKKLDKKVIKGQNRRSRFCHMNCYLPLFPI